jgi:tRNA (adenine22-N1)-methyltransferase
MSSFRVGVAHSKRLTKLQSFYSSEINVWDIGCDHGELGLSFISIKSVKKINLVDPSSKVIEQLNVRLKDSYITSPRIEVIHKKGQELNIKSENNIIFIAGMGGKEIGQIIQTQIEYLDSNSKIVISPHKNILELRRLLNQMPLSLINEDIVFENNQFYQVIALKPDRSFSSPRVSLFGGDLWTREHSEDYRNHLLKYFSHHRGALSQDYVNYLKSLVF